MPTRPSPEQVRRAIAPDDPTRAALDNAAWNALDALRLYKEGRKDEAELRNLDTLSKASAAGYFLATARINKESRT